KSPDNFCAVKESFIGCGDLRTPESITQTMLCNSEANFQVPIACMQYRVALDPNQEYENNLLFGPAQDEQEVESIRLRHFDVENKVSIERVRSEFKSYMGQIKGCVEIESPDKEFDQLVNHWLPRQVYYHGELNRLTSDPQTRNFLQDNMGMSYFKPEVTRRALLHAMSQQHFSGEMPDGILMHSDAELKYINQIPHTDHCIWLPIVMQAYLAESNDQTILEEEVGYIDNEAEESVYLHINKAMDWLINARDENGLSLIGQGDWCDPMNMVGVKGKGVSSWLSLATSFALSEWSQICQTQGNDSDANKFNSVANAINNSVNKHLWDGQWYARGITDEGIAFGTSKDPEGSIYLNPQSWALLANTASKSQKASILEQIEKQLKTPFGNMMLAPSYTKMREDIGRLTQKHPGVSENGSVYNHAAIFYAYALYSIDENDRAFEILADMFPKSSDENCRGQVPTFIPNYYRGAYYQIPLTAGRSSQLLHTGTVSWYYRCLVEELCGLKGQSGSLVIKPKLPSTWDWLKVKRQYLGATFDVSIKKVVDNGCTSIKVDGVLNPEGKIKAVKKGQHYSIEIAIAATEEK
ncbi:MAG: hypothetical protein OQK04_07290, partial [Kangiellaceae bacterium]|nr:hypothetical protein [Kangiellaceae bacterium]